MRIVRRCAAAVAAAIAVLALPGCNVAGSGRILEPPIPPQTVFQVLGDIGTPFSATISDTTSSWQITGSIPTLVTIINPNPPVRMVAAKLQGSNSLLSLQLLAVNVVVDFSSTIEPFGSASVQLGGTLSALAPPASPDIRFFVKGPYGELFTGLIEDQKFGYAVQSNAPALFLFERPNGSVDGLFTQAVNLGSFDIDLVVNGAVVASAQGGPSVSIK